MPHVIECLDPFKPFADPKPAEVAAGVTIRGWLQERFPGFVEFERPTIAILNGEAVLRRDWGKQLEEGDILVFVAQPGAQPLIYLLISVIVSIAVSLLMPKPKYDTTESESVYSIRGQQNRVRLNDPVECSYGKCRLWPSYAALPYNRYIGNEQYQFALLCLGQGEHEIHAVQIEDTAIENFKEVEYAIYGPGEAVTLFDDRVTTSSEVSNLELLGSNEDGYEGFAGPFTANEAGSTTTRLEVDLVLPMGLYTTTSKGKIRNGQVTCLVEYRKIDDYGAPLGDWVTFATRDWVMNVAVAQRFTIALDVPAGRYELRAKRTNEKDKNTSSANLLQWAALRAVLPSVRNYGNKTMLAIKMRATNNLNDQSAYRVNVWATRKIPTWNVATGWSVPTATRSIVWALCDVMRSQYGGQLGDAYLPLADLATLDATYSAEGRFFDYIFDQRSSVWEAAKIIARVGRAVPMLEGSQVHLIRDVPRTLPTMLFNQNNIVADSFKWNITLPKDGDYDGVKIEYTDPLDFLPRQVVCLIGDDGTAIPAPRSGHPGDDVGNNLEEVKFLGCTSRDWAYREGCYFRASKRRLRQSVSLETGLEGNLPRYGALIGVSHDLPRWASGGFVTTVAGDHRTLTLTEPVTFGAGPHYIGVRLRDGSSSVPLLCTAGADSSHVVLAADIPAAFLISEQIEPPVFAFGPGAKWVKNCVVSSITPDADNKVRIEAFVYQDEVFTNDALTAPAVVSTIPPVTHTPDVPSLNCPSVGVSWLPGSNTQAVVTWAPADGATSYEVETSADSGATWIPRGFTATTALEFPCNEGGLFIRVRPIGKGIGEWCEHDYSMTEDADPWGDTEPGTIPELSGTAPAVPASGHAIEEAGGSKAFCGWAEYSGHESSPPKLYRNRTLSGAYIGQTRASGLYVNTSTYAYSGVAITANSGVYCTITQNGSMHNTLLDHGGNTTDYGTSAVSQVLRGQSPTGTTTYTATTATSTGNDIWQDLGNQIEQRQLSSSSAVETLSGEVTEASIVTEILASNDWQASSILATAVRNVRLTGSTVIYKKLRFRASVQVGQTIPGFPGCEAWSPYSLSANVSRAAINEAGTVTGSWVAASPVVLQTFADGSGFAAFPDWAEIIPVQGYATRIDSITLEAK